MMVLWEMGIGVHMCQRGVLGSLGALVGGFRIRQSLTWRDDCNRGAEEGGHSGGVWADMRSRELVGGGHVQIACDGG